MIKLRLMLVFFYITSASGAQNQEGTTLQIGKTKVHLGWCSDNNIINISSRIDIFYCGKNEQEKLNGKENYCYTTGLLQRNRNNQEIYLNEGTKLRICKNPIVLQITEPRIIKEDRELENSFLYNVLRMNSRIRVPLVFEFKEDFALSEAKKDLKKCCNILLSAYFTGMEKKNNKHIALLCLKVEHISKQIMAHITLSAMYEFIKNNPQSYANIYLLVNTAEEYNAYRNEMDAIRKEIHF